MAVWGKNFSLPDPVTAEKMAQLETKFVDATRQQVKFGPSSVSDFTKWRVNSATAFGSGFGVFLSPPRDPSVLLISGWDPSQGIFKIPDGTGGGLGEHGDGGRRRKMGLNPPKVSVCALWSTKFRVDVW